MPRQRPALQVFTFLLGLFVLGAGAMALDRMPAATNQTQAGRPPGTNYKSPAFTFNKIAEGVYHAVATGSLIVMSNAVIIEGDRDVLVVDSHVSPAGAWVLREELKAITPKPIRYVVNSHFHFDHSHGNQVYGPEVEIIGHDFARAQMAAGKSMDSPAREFYVGVLPAQIKGLEERLAKVTSEAGSSDPANVKERATIQSQLDIARNFFEGTNAVTPTPPTVTLDRTMTLHRGSREIRIMFLGRGHTGGDVVV